MTGIQPIAVVTGANRGIGLATVRELGRRGYQVFLTARHQAEADEAASTLQTERLNVFPREMDVTVPDSIDALADEIEDRELRVDALINNAGIALDGFDTTVVRQTLSVNFFGPLRVTETLLPLMAPHGRIVMVSSGLGQLERLPDSLRQRLLAPELDRDALVQLLWQFTEAVGADADTTSEWPRNAYAVSKAALNALTRLLAKEAGDGELHINAISPGWVRTRMGGAAAPNSPEQAADGIAWAADLPADGPNGGFFQNRQPIDW